MLKNRNSFLQNPSEEYINKLGVRFVSESYQSLHAAYACVKEVLSQYYLFVALLVFFNNSKLCKIVRWNKGTVAWFQKYIYYVCVFHVRVPLFEIVVEE